MAGPVSGTDRIRGRGQRSAGEPVAGGYTVDAYYQEALASERYRRILALYCGDVTVTPAQILQYYLDAFVNPDRLRYENDIPLYESEILQTGNEAFYTPQGYRRIKHILLAYPQEITEAPDQIDSRVQQAQAVKDEAYDALARAAADGLDIAPPMMRPMRI